MVGPTCGSNFLAHESGPCESDEDCPPNLYCIQFDCWTVPEKPIRHLSHLTHGRRDSRSETLRSFAMKRHSPKVYSTYTSTSNDSPLDTSLAPPPSLPSTLATINNTNYSQLRTLAFPGFNYKQNQGGEADRPPSRSPPSIKTLSPATIAQEFDKDVIFDPDWDKNDDSSSRIGTTTSRSIEQVDSPETEDQLSKAEVPREHLESQAHTDKGKVEGEWQEMRNSQTIALPTTPSTPKDGRIFFDYSKENRVRKPVRVQVINARESMQDECNKHRDCGKTYICCKKRWCDLSDECGLAKFCLPNCQLTKMTYLSSSRVQGEPLLDLIYD